MANQGRCALLIVPLLVGCGVVPSNEKEQPSTSTAEVTSPAKVSVTDTPAWRSTLDRLTAELSEQVAGDGVAGLAVGVVANGDVVWSGGFGWAERDEQVQMAPDAVFGVGSISRSVTAVLLMRLVDRGVIGLDDPVLPHLPELAAVDGWGADDPSVTFRHLASHTSGLERNYGEGLAMPVDRWQEGVLESLANVTFDAAPGVRYQDSPLGYGALGLALERAAGTPFVELANTEVFGPLGMTASSFGPQEGEHRARRATPYENRLDGGLAGATAARQFGAQGYTLPSSGLYSTVEDLGRLLGAITGVSNREVLSESNRAELIAVQTPGGLTPPRGPGYPATGPRPAMFRDGEGRNIRSPEVLDPPQGLGVAIQPVPDGGRIVHSGGIVGGYAAYMAVDTETGVGVVLLRNYWRGSTDLRRSTIGMVTELSSVGRQRATVWTRVPSPLLWFGGALVAGLLFNAFLGRSIEPPRRRGRPLAR